MNAKITFAISLPVFVAFDDCFFGLVEGTSFPFTSQKSPTLIFM